MKPADRTTGLAAFIATLVAVVLLSKIGGSGADLAIMTGLIGVLGMLAPGLVPSRGNERDTKPSGTPGDPVSVTETDPHP
ncbi:hypothetical protein [Novosphingobium sp. M1R2S20]|uniref:Uncharacterized protein n=1 Tax=Novosphingobium rhizovicinum TaxID=3228928 RepID=A0ABV3RDM8_9SPHN